MLMLLQRPACTKQVGCLLVFSLCHSDCLDLDLDGRRTRGKKLQNFLSDCLVLVIASDCLDLVLFEVGCFS